MTLKNKTILITGASSGIGLSCAKLFAKHGAKIILLARRKNILEEISAKLHDKFNTDSYILPLDITNKNQIEKVFSELPNKWKKIDVLINNAGLALGIDKIPEGNINDWETMINTNILGLLYVTRKIIPLMIKENSGHIINIGSISSHEVYPGGAVYCASKHAERAITKGLKLDLTGKNIRVSSVDPGMVETEFSLVRFKQDSNKAKQVYADMTPLKAEDIAETILFVITRPAHVNISEIQVLPLDQSSTTLINRNRR